TIVTNAVPALASKFAGTAAVSCVALTNVVVNAVPFHCKVAPDENPAPFTVSVNPPLPAAAVLRLIDVTPNGVKFGIRSYVSVELLVCPSTLVWNVAVCFSSCGVAGNVIVGAMVPPAVTTVGPEDEEPQIFNVSVPLTIGLRNKLRVPPLGSMMMDALE